jgi:hypothetical protein
MPLSVSQPVRCAQCGELNSPYAEVCIICRGPLAPRQLQSVLPSNSPAANRSPMLSESESSTMPARSTMKPVVAWLSAMLVFVLIAGGLTAARVIATPGLVNALRGKLTTAPSSPGVSALPATAPLDRELVMAVSKNDVESVRRLLDQGANPATASSKSAVPVLCMAANRGSLPVVQLLVDRGCDVNIKMSDRIHKGDLVGGFTALHFAGMKGHEDVIQYLLSNGADVTKQTTDGDTPLGTAAILGTPGAVRLLIDAGSDVNHKTNDGMTPLLGAAQQGKTENVRVLLEKGADINLRGPFGDSALFHAEKANHPDTAQVLRDAGVF